MNAPLTIMMFFFLKKGKTKTRKDLHSTELNGGGSCLFVHSFDET